VPQAPNVCCFSSQPPHEKIDKRENFADMLPGGTLGDTLQGPEVIGPWGKKRKHAPMDRKREILARDGAVGVFGRVKKQKTQTSKANAATAGRESFCLGNPRKARKKRVRGLSSTKDSTFWRGKCSLWFLEKKPAKPKSNQIVIFEKATTRGKSGPRNSQAKDNKTGNGFYVGREQKNSGQSSTVQWDVETRFKPSEGGGGGEEGNQF